MNKNNIYCYFHDLSANKNVRTKTIRRKTFINIWITKVKLFRKKSRARVLTLQCNSYLSHVWSFFKIPSNFLSLISLYPLFKNAFQHTFISVNNRGRAPSKYVNKLAIGFYLFIPEVKQYGWSWATRQYAPKWFDPGF